MKAEMECKQPTPSVIARLMGLDEPPPPRQPAQKRARVLSDTYLQRVASIGVRKKRTEQHSFRLCIEEQKGCEDTFQALEMSKRAKHHPTSFGMRGVRRLNNCHNAKEITDSRRDGFVNYFRESDHELGKKLNDLHNVPWHSSSMPITELKSLHSFGLRDNGLSMKSWWGNKQGYVNRLLIPSSRIVVLEPNSGKFQDAARYCISSTSSSKVSQSVDRKNKGIFSRQKENIVELNKRKSMANGMGPFQPRSRFSKDNAKRLGHAMSSSSMGKPQIEVMNDNISAEDSGLKSTTSTASSNMMNRFSDELHTPREARKQILEKWTTTKKYQQIDLSKRGKTLQQVPAVADDELRPMNLDDKPDNCGLSNEVGAGNGTVAFGSPLGISSWDEHVRDLPKCRSLIANFNAVGSSDITISHDFLQNGRHMRTPEFTELIENESRNQNFEQNGVSECRNSVSSFENSSSAYCSQSEKNHLPEAECVIQNQLENELQEDSSSQSSSISKSPEQQGCTFLSHSIKLAEAENVPHFLNTSVQQVILTTTSEEDSANSNCSVTEPKSPVSLEEISQPSPTSVLRTLYEEEISSGSDCFRSVSASLNSLHMQLELLKSDTSETYSEGSGMMVSSDDDTRGGSVCDYEDNEDIIGSFKVDESRDFSYLVDVLAEAGLHSRNLDICFDSWLSHEALISSSVFETLEKKYGGEQMSWKRSERKLLFDRINLGLVEILQLFIGMLASSKPVAKRLNSKHGQAWIEEELWLLLISQENEATKESEKFLGKDDKWLDMEEDIQEIGKEIENSLIDELVADAISIDSF